jgi:hypothetical protein
MGNPRFPHPFLNCHPVEWFPLAHTLLATGGEFSEVGLGFLAGKVIWNYKFMVRFEPATYILPSFTNRRLAYSESLSRFRLGDAFSLNSLRRQQCPSLGNGLTHRWLANVKPFRRFGLGDAFGED